MTATDTHAEASQSHTALSSTTASSSTLPAQSSLKVQNYKTGNLAHLTLDGLYRLFSLQPKSPTKTPAAIKDLMVSCPQCNQYGYKRGKLVPIAMNSTRAREHLVQKCAGIDITDVAILKRLVADCMLIPSSHNVDSLDCN